MRVVVAGTFRTDPADWPALKPHAEAVIAASRAEDGCLVYGFAVDVQDPALYHVFEIWRDQACLDAHFQSAHMAAWRAAREANGFHDRKIETYSITD